MNKLPLPSICTYDELIAIAERWIEGGWQKGDASSLDSLHAQNFIDHDPAGREANLKGFKQGLADLYDSFPDFYAEISNMVVDESSQQVAIQWTANGTHQGKFMDILPTGRRVQFKGIEVISIENGFIHERWGEWDGLDILNQLGL